MESRLVSETIFSQFMYKILPTCNHLFIFKKQFCAQLALSGEFLSPEVLKPCLESATYCQECLLCEGTFSYNAQACKLPHS